MTPQHPASCPTLQCPLIQPSVHFLTHNFSSCSLNFTFTTPPSTNLPSPPSLSGKLGAEAAPVEGLRALPSSPLVGEASLPLLRLASSLGAETQRLHS